MLGLEPDRGLGQRRRVAAAVRGRPAWSAWRWAALPLAVLYLILLAARLRGVIDTTELDADAVSAPVIGELFAGAGPHASIVLGTFGWYATLLFELSTKWLPDHRQVWEIAPYAMALAGAGLTAWAVAQIAGRWAAGVTAALLICAAPPTLHLLLSTTQHGPDWFCCALLAAFLVLILRPSSADRPVRVGATAVLVGILVGVNAASDVLVTIAGLVPFALAVIAAHALARGPATARALKVSALMAVVIGLTWALTAVAMSAMHVGPQPGLDTTKLAAVDQLRANVGLWWRSIVALGNGDTGAHPLSLQAVLRLACAAASLIAVAALPVLGVRELRPRRDADSAPAAPARLAFIAFWCSSAILLSAAFVFSSLPSDIHSDRYLVGLVYAVAATIPVFAAGRRRAQAIVVAGAGAFALSAVVSMAQNAYTRNPSRFPSTGLSHQIATVAARHHLTIGYAGYWDASAITWATDFHVRVYPVSICDQNKRLCRFDLHVITSWYRRRPGIHSFLLIDPAQPLVPSPTPDLGRPDAILHVGRILMYVYPYDLAKRIVS